MFEEKDDIKMNLFFENDNPSKEQIEEFQKIDVFYFEKFFRSNALNVNSKIFRAYVEHSTLDAFVLLLNKLCENRFKMQKFMNRIYVGNYDEFKLIEKIMKLDKKISFSLGYSFLKVDKTYDRNILFECFGPFFNIPSQAKVDSFLEFSGYETSTKYLRILYYDCKFAKRKKIISLFLECKRIKKVLNHYLSIEKQKIWRYIKVFSIARNANILIRKANTIATLSGKSDIFSGLEMKIKNLKVNYAFFVFRNVVFPDYSLRLPK